MRRWPGLDPDAVRESNRKQAVVPRGATVLEPVGTAPGLVVPPASGSGPTVVVLPGPPRELQPMWEMARATEAFAAAIAGARSYGDGSCACSGSRSPRSRTRCGLPIGERASRSRSSRSRPACAAARSRSRRGTSRPAEAGYRAFVEFLAAPWRQLFSLDGSTVDEQVGALLADRPVAVAESCTGGLMSARLTELPGLLGVLCRGRRRLLERGQDLSGRRRSGSDRAASARSRPRSPRRSPPAPPSASTRRYRGRDHRHRRTRTAAPRRSRSGSVCFSVCGPEGARITRRTRLPGNRADVRDRSTTVAMHLLRRLLVEGRRRFPRQAPGSPSRA